MRDSPSECRMTTLSHSSQRGVMRLWRFYRLGMNWHRGQSLLSPSCLPFHYCPIMLAGNRAYEERFDRVFLIRAAGRGAGEILAELERRLGNDDATERAETLEQLRQIALLRLEPHLG